MCDDASGRKSGANEALTKAIIPTRIVGRGMCTTRLLSVQ